MRNPEYFEPKKLEDYFKRRTVNVLIEILHELETAEDTIWFDDNTTVFEMCWSVGEKHGYGEKLRQEFPQYA